MTKELKDWLLESNGVAVISRAQHEGSWKWFVRLTYKRGESLAYHEDEEKAIIQALQEMPK